jgi:hypothetical protein
MSPAHYYNDPESSSEVPSWLTLAMFIICNLNGAQFFAVKLVLTTYTICITEIAVSIRLLLLIPMLKSAVQ